MANQGRRDPRRHGRSSRAASWSAVGAASGAASGSLTAPTTASPTSAANPLATRATYRSLLLRGLAPDEAANLTAFLCGIHVGAQPWKLPEVNRLLFLRELQQAGRFGADDGAEAPGTAA